MAQVIPWLEALAQSKTHPWAPTTLSNVEEKHFKDWITTTPWYENMTQRIPEQYRKDAYNELINRPGVDYDYRGAWQAGLAPEYYPYSEPNNPEYHWASSTPDGRMLKAPDHSTAWMEYFARNYGTMPEAVGLRSIEDAMYWEATHSTPSLVLKPR